MHRAVVAVRLATAVPGAVFMAFAAFVAMPTLRVCRVHALAHLRVHLAHAGAVAVGRRRVLRGWRAVLVFAGEGRASRRGDGQGDECRSCSGCGNSHGNLQGTGGLAAGEIPNFVRRAALQALGGGIVAAFAQPQGAVTFAELGAPGWT